MRITGGLLAGEMFKNMDDVKQSVYGERKLKKESIARFQRLGIKRKQKAMTLRERRVRLACALDERINGIKVVQKGVLSNQKLSKGVQDGTLFAEQGIVLEMRNGPFADSDTKVDPR